MQQPFQRQIQRVPAYSSEGHRIRSFSLEAVWRLLILGKVTATVNRHDHIVCIHFRDRGPEVKPQAASAVRFEILPGGNRIYWLRGLPKSWSHEPIEFPNAPDLPPPVSLLAERRNNVIEFPGPRARITSEKKAA